MGARTALRLERLHFWHTDQPIGFVLLAIAGLALLVLVTRAALAARRAEDGEFPYFVAGLTGR